MWFSWNDFGGRVASMHDALSHLNRLARHEAQAPPPDPSGRFVLTETPEHYDFRIDLPGVLQEDLDLDLHEQTMTLSARREIGAPDGYAAHRTERSPFAWKRSLTLPARIDPERVHARLAHGTLTVRIAKAAEITPRRVQIEAS